MIPFADKLNLSSTTKIFSAFISLKFCCFATVSCNKNIPFRSTNILILQILFAAQKSALRFEYRHLSFNTPLHAEYRLSARILHLYLKSPHYTTNISCPLYILFICYPPHGFHLELSNPNDHNNQHYHSTPTNPTNKPNPKNQPLTQHQPSSQPPTSQPTTPTTLTCSTHDKPSTTSTTRNPRAA